MLDPYDRLQLVGALRPPEGYAFDEGVGTTFSLDLISLLTVPLSLVLCEFESPKAAFENREAVLEGLRRISGKLHVFCHRGRIKRPKEGLLLFALLEDMVAGVLPENKQGSFHPKIWILRYKRDNDRLLRVLVLSRNLTFDKSWDIALVLEGMLQPARSSSVQRNARLAQFIRKLPALAAGSTVQTRKALELLATDVLRTEFECPPEFDELAFWPLGIGESVPNNLFKAQHSRLMVVSPFISDLLTGKSKGVLDALLWKRTTVERNILVSRPDQLDALPVESLVKLRETTDIFYMDDAAAHGEDDGELTDNSILERPKEELSGLHAKVYVVEDGAQVCVFAGSANATSAAWGRHGDVANVEFIVELRGARNRIGIDSLLGKGPETESGAGGLSKLLKPYSLRERPIEIDIDQRNVEKLIDEARQALAAAPMSVTVASLDNESYSASLLTGSFEPEPNVKYMAWPIMLPPGRAQSLDRSRHQTALVFSPLPITALTPFWAFRLSATVGSATESVEFVMDVPVEGMPEGRLAALMAKMIDSSDRFLAYLALLLSDDAQLPGMDGSDRIRRGRGAKGDGTLTWNSAILLENLVRSFSRNPERLERIGRLMEDLRTGGSLPGVIPADFEEIWKAFAPGGH